MECEVFFCYKRNSAVCENAAIESIAIFTRPFSAGVPDFEGRHSEMPDTDAIEMACICKAAFCGNLGDGHIAVAQIFKSQTELQGQMIGMAGFADG